MKRDRKGIIFKKEIVATLGVIVAMIVLTSILFLRIYALIEKKCWDVLRENSDTISADIVKRLEEDRQVLHVLADTIAGYDSMDSLEVKNYIASFTPRTISSYIALLLPDNTVILPDRVIPNSGLSFEKEAALGAHTSDRVISVKDENKLVVRNFLPIEQNGEIVAMLYGAIDLEMLPELLEFNAYEGRGAVYIFDGNTGDVLLDTWHKNLGNAYDIESRPVKPGYDYDEMRTDSFSGGTGTIVFVSGTIGEYLYYYYEPVANNNWTMALSIQESIAFREVLVVKKILILFVIIEAFLFLSYLVWMLWHVRKTTQKDREQNILLEEALHRAESAGKAKSKFLSNMSHDIRTPMNAIIGFTGIAKAHIDEKERVKDCLDKITSSSNHLLSLINDVLDMSKIESGRIQLQEQECNLSEIMHNFMNIIHSQISAKDLKLFIDSKDMRHENVYMDSLRLNQVLINIVGNSIKYTEPQGSITIQLRELPSDSATYGNYTISIKDTGIGMGEEYLPHIFEVFTREKNTTISKIEGTGLGLPISKHIIDMMGGTISVSSELGKGSEFIISLSLKLQDAEESSPYIKQLSGLRALVVDDDFEVCSSVSNMLERIGMVPDWTLSGKEAVLRAEQAQEVSKPYAAYIIDWRIPDIDGVEVMRQLRKIVEDDIPIIILTAYDYSDIEKEAREAGATAFCQKPLFISNLKETLLKGCGLKGQSVEEPLEGPIQFEGRRILLAEDNELNREIAVEILGEAQFIVETAVNGQVAVDMVKASEPGYYDAVLMDIQMPVMDGYQAAQEIQKLGNKELASIPIIALTANAFEEDKREAFEKGMNGHIAKPIELEQLFQVLKTVMK